MPDEMIIRHCAPTLAGMKTGNMFTYHFKDASELRETVRRLNTLLKVSIPSDIFPVIFAKAVKNKFPTVCPSTPLDA